MLRLDHVVYAVPDLDLAAVRFREEFGLDSTEGGRHRRWGTANRIMPLGDQYLGSSPRWTSRWLPRRVRQRACSNALPEAAARPIAAVADDLDAVASRLGLEVGSGSRTRTDSRSSVGG